ncbi:unnamed protein product [Kuraishia capsulata CBS 1993]|uniref:Histone-binding protein RBBP4-like N-terminal domain-containing protein n=1 Tax=Kuraishia capsulata CBS 1993 TaxID=1382522 RepID=W6MI12_9ASCO|nr:uncharacterized protein KUCA_T00001975001 [Kuraishia capsulata CBS 1993]CDK26004.1 unnamed protein product [Kuraishia capsulata CBS 1993]
MAPAVENPSKATHDALRSYRTAEKVINEEFKIWKKTSPLLYDLVYSYALEWPALTIDWLPGTSTNDDGTLSAQFISGTHTSGNADDYLKLYSVDLPATLAGGAAISIPSSPSGCKFKEVKSWKHPGEVNKARYNPLSSTIATMTNTGAVLLYSLDQALPFKKLEHHTKEGYGLEWHPSRQSWLLTSTEDAIVALWDVSSASDKPSHVIDSHTASVNDLSWNPQIPDVFASVSDSSHLHLHDLRSSSLSKPIVDVQAHDGAVNCVSFHPELSNFLVTAGADAVVNAWDLRNPATPVRSLSGHSAPVTQLAFKPNSSYLASAGSDRRVLVWDFSLLAPGDDSDEDHPPELVFVHGGHTTRLGECAWHPDLSNVIASVAEDGLVDVWRPHFADDESEKESDVEMEE